MNTASLELCEELHKLSGWENTHFNTWLSTESDEVTTSANNALFGYGVENKAGSIYCIPAYDCGYLLRKLPAYVESGHIELANFDTAGWKIGYYNGNPTLKMLEYTIQNADTPEDALCKLAIELFKVGVLKRS